MKTLPSGPSVRDESLPEAFDALLDGSSEAVLVLDAEGRVLRVNPSAASLYGAPAEALVGKYERELNAAPDGEAALASGGGGTLLTARRAGGPSVPVEVRRYPFDLGGASGALCLVRPRGESSRAEGGCYQSAFHEAEFGVVLLDADGRFLETNRAFRELVGRSAEALAALRWRDLVHPRHRAKSQRRQEGLYSGAEEAYAEERWLVRPDGATVTVLLRIAPVRSATGAVERALGLVEDISERKQLEARLLVAERLAALGTLAAGIAHEINNPIAAVLANMRYVLTELEGGSSRPGDLIEAAKDAVAGASRVRDIVRELKQFSREGNDQQETADVAEVLRSVARLVRHELHSRAQLVAQIDPVPRVAANAARLGQVFLNLLLNAAQALPLGEPGVHEVRISARLAGPDRVRVEVTDTGRGIPAEELGRIFDPFFTTREVGEGNGLGLSICHALVTSFGGTIEAESTLGRGSTFRVLLPVAGAAS